MTFRYNKIGILIDLGAERTIGAERGSEKIAVEIKSFLHRSIVNDFENALGQYRFYRRILSFNEPNRKIYLAVRKEVYDKVFIEQKLLAIAELEEVSIIVADVAKEEILEWIKH